MVIQPAADIFLFIRITEKRLLQCRTPKLPTDNKAPAQQKSFRILSSVKHVLHDFLLFHFIGIRCLFFGWEFLYLLCYSIIGASLWDQHRIINSPLHYWRRVCFFCVYIYITVSVQALFYWRFVSVQLGVSFLCAFSFSNGGMVLMRGADRLR